MLEQVVDVEVVAKAFEAVAGRLRRSPPLGGAAP